VREEVFMFAKSLADKHMAACEYSGPIHNFNLPLVGSEVFQDGGNFSEKIDLDNKFHWQKKNLIRNAILDERDQINAGPKAEVYSI